MTRSASSTEVWQKFLRKCLVQRLDVPKFETFAKSLSDKTPITSTDLANTLLSTQTYPTNAFSVDPRYLLYIQNIVSAGLVSLADILNTLLQSSQNNDTSQLKVEDGVTVPSREPVDTAILMSLVVLVPSLKTGPTTKDGMQTLMVVISQWMNAVIAASDGDGLGGVLNNTGLEELGLGGGVMGKQKKECVGEIVAAIGENEALGSWMRGILGKDKRLSFETTLPMFSQVFHNTNMTLASRLDALVPKKNQANGLEGENALLGRGLGDLNMNDAGGDLMGINAPAQLCRGGLYVFFHALLVGMPLIDDDYILNYLHNRYRGDQSTAATEMIIAVLDCLSNSTNRSETTRSLCRHFLVNKVPLLLVKLQIPAMTAHFVINNALIKSNAASMDPSIGSDSMMLDLSNDVKQEFLFSCALHGVIEEHRIEEILGEIPLQTMPSKRYVVDELVDECLADPDREERLLAEIDESEGNSGAAALAIVKVVRVQCEQRNTMPLRNICNFLTRKPKNVDFILLYAKPSEFLESLCELLDSWKYEEDQGEYQPVYEEFGYILLLVLTVIYRYNLTVYDLGNVSEDSFVPQLLKKGSRNQSMESLSSSGGSMHALLGRWISALYEDGEGISDDLLSSCQPQDFFLLVPTLFAQSIEAFNRNILDMTILKSGLEYFHLPFLVASQISALTWLTNYLWESHSETEIQHALKILHALLFPDDKLPADVAETHRTIICICARNLERVLRELIRLDHTLYQRGAEPIFQMLSAHLVFNRSGSPSQTEMDSWNNAGNFLQALKNSIQSLIMWSANPDINITPPTYTHRLLLSTWRIFGSKAVVKGLVDEVFNIQTQAQTSLSGTGSTELALDIVVTMISAPTAEAFTAEVTEVQTGVKINHNENIKNGNNGTTGSDGHIDTGRMSLSDALKYLASDTKMAMEEPQKMEIVVKLNRRVEQQMSVVSAGVRLQQNQHLAVIVDEVNGGMLDLMAVDGMSAL